MSRKKWRVWLSGRGPDREDIIETLKAGGYEVTLGRLFTDTLTGLRCCQSAKWDTNRATITVHSRRLAQAPER